MWKQTIPTTMQEFGDYCKNMVQDNGNNGNSISITLRDTRDNNTYTVAKLKDGKCWMTQDLRIQNYTLNSNDSDVSSTFVLPSSSIPWKTVNETTSNVYYRDSNYGAYYSWNAATAGGGSLTGGDAPCSICPKGWKLPSNTEGSNLGSLGLNCKAPPMNFHDNHGYFNGQNYSSDSVSWYWTSTATNSQYGYRAGNLYCSGTSIGVGPYNSTTGQKQFGNPVRCLSRQ